MLLPVVQDRLGFRRADALYRFEFGLRGAVEIDRRPGGQRKRREQARKQRLHDTDEWVTTTPPSPARER